MIFNISDKLRINSTSKYSWEVEELIEVKDKEAKTYGKKTWRILTYHSNLKMACKSILDKGLVLSEDLDAILHFMDQVYSYAERCDNLLKTRYKS